MRRKKREREREKENKKTRKIKEKSVTVVFFADLMFFEILGSVTFFSQTYYSRSWLAFPRRKAFSPAPVKAAKE